MIFLKTHAFFVSIVMQLFMPAARLHAQAPQFGERLDLGIIEYAKISEASGIAASQKNKNVLWTHNDSGDKKRIYAFNAAGQHLGIFWIKGAKARDWEDMALGPGPEEGRDYLYIGDIGDNNAEYDLKYLYRLPEPRVTAQGAQVDTLTEVETITFQYPDGRRDAETLMIDPPTKDVYVVSKREATVHLYRAAYPQSISETITLEHAANLKLGGVVAGDISRDGGEILIKTYDAIYYWQRRPGQTIAQALSQMPVKVPYMIEPQGEAVCWHPEGGGYYTISEEFQKIPAHLYFYPRVQSSAGERKTR